MTVQNTSQNASQNTHRAATETTGSTTPATPASPSRAGLAYGLVLLAVAAVSSCLLEVAWLFARISTGADGQTAAFPVMIAMAAVINCAMVLESRKWGRSWVVQGFPLAVWLLTLVCLHLGPGGNMPVPPSLRGMLLLVAGIGVPVVLVQALRLRQLTGAGGAARVTRA